MFLYWSALKFACENGYRFFDFGRCTPGKGTYRFKEQWGAKPMQLYWYYWVRNNGPAPDVSPQNPKFQLAIWLWRHVLVTLTRQMGQVIVKNLP
jgi:hypothetical protein